MAKEYWTVKYEQSAYPAGIRSYPFPTPEAAFRFAGNNLKQPSVGRCWIVDPQGKTMVDSTSKHKHTVEWTQGAGRKETVRNEACPDPDNCN